MTCCIKIPHEISKITFGINKDEEEKKKWEVALGVLFKKSNRVCSNHFYKEDLNNTWTSDEGTIPYTVCLKRWHLKKLPYFYLNCLLPEIVDPVFKHRLMISDIREPNKSEAVKSTVKTKLF